MSWKTAAIACCSQCRNFLCGVSSSAKIISSQLNIFYGMPSDEVHTSVNPSGALTINFEMDLGSGYGRCNTVSLDDPKYLGYLCNAQDGETTLGFSPTKENYVHHGKHIQNSSVSPATVTRGSDHVPERSLPTLVVAGVSIALVLLCILIVAVFWYAWKKSQEGSMELNPIPYGEAGVSLRSLSVPENQQEWPLERAAQ